MTDSASVRASERPVKPFEPVASPLHTIGLLLIIAAVGYFAYRMIHPMPAARANHLFSYSASIVWEWAAVGYIAWGIRRTGKSLRDLVRGSWQTVRGFLVDLGIAFGFWLAALVVLGILNHFLHASGSREAARALAPQGPLESLLWVALSTTAGFCEEVIFRGYFQRQLGAWTRNAPAGVVLSAALFGAAHAYQGSRGTLLIGAFGLMFGILAESRRSLRPGIMVHAWHDTITGLLMRFVPK